MHLQITFRHMEHTPSLDQKINEKLTKVRNFLSENARVEWTSYMDGELAKTDLKVVDHGREYYQSSEDASLYKTFDQVIQKLKRRLSEDHQESKEHIHRQKVK